MNLHYFQAGYLSYLKTEEGTRKWGKKTYPVLLEDTSSVEETMSTVRRE